MVSPACQGTPHFLNFHSLDGINPGRSRPASTGAALNHGDIHLDTERHRVVRAGRELKLGPTEYRLLVTLLEKPGRVFSRDQLLDHVWGRDVYVDTRTVDVHIARLRKTLTSLGGDDPIRTVRGAGFMIQSP